MNRNPLFVHICELMGPRYGWSPHIGTPVIANLLDAWLNIIINRNFEETQPKCVYTCVHVFAITITYGSLYLNIAQCIYKRQVYNCAAAASSAWFNQAVMEAAQAL